MARALLARPELLLLDEPTASLDARNEGLLRRPWPRRRTTARCWSWRTGCPRCSTATRSSCSTGAGSSPAGPMPSWWTAARCTASSPPPSSSCDEGPSSSPPLAGSRRAPGRGPARSGDGGFSRPSPLPWRCP
ncbi:hypothetical protein [Blastococcus brunescens]|uniref:ATP-binding cassette domain-containing protein n=1 Tax=Blastococcus brunescens TaxID=1564165 RepID=A0ABZ1BBW6_9ACTN|nr:hypothetical protein [Blastococcus sp. BMG 8361]WRL67234.1 hypothetical protein U6N30_30005 [Blastococcus sp. BMG 8361]